MAGHSRPKDGVASLAYDPAISLRDALCLPKRDHRDNKPGDDKRRTCVIARGVEAPGTPFVPFSVSPMRGMERREGARAVVHAALSGDGEAPLRVWRDARPLGEAGGHPRALHPAARVVGAPHLAPPS